MPERLDLLLAGEPMQALADRALFWPARRRLLLADLHLGKGNILRAAGIAVPSGGTGQDLARLDALLRHTGARSLWILGDFLHGARHAGVDAAWRALRDAHPDVEVAVVAGNHDRALAPAAFGLASLPEDVRDGPFRFRHAPLRRRQSNGGHVVCGHLHPVVRVPGLPGRLPAFQLEAGQTVLPAFSMFTGGAEAARDGGWIACVHGHLLAHAPG
ncbi:ligase-associated DNA damage response endonuclease PdeM [Luteimonas notoginsengisoli]|uniref:Ligase-associated DNA damage response endonuclease PdeM n=1 Tax=Luteimonas notoginsengisoli TaxID=1578200 RepID=A0ABV7US27_9GAMM